MSTTTHARPRRLIDRSLGVVPASDPDSERALLAAVVVDPANLDRVADLVSPTDFGDPDLAALFGTLQTLHDAGQPVGDVVFLVSELKRASIPENVRTAAFLAGLLRDGIVWNASYYARAVRRAAALRRLADLATTLTARTATAGAEPTDLQNWLDAQLQLLGHRVADPPRLIDQLALELVADLERDDGAVRGLFSGLPSLDSATGGFQPGELVILAARPGVGKTSLAMQIATHNATRGRPVLFVSLEMTGRELTARMLAGLAGVDSRRVRAGRLDDRPLADLRAAAVQVTDLPLRIWSPPSAALPRIRGVAKQEAAVGGLAMLVVDYLGLVRPDDRGRPRHEQVGEVSAALKSLAKELSVPVLALCQLNREADGAEPRLSHLRESGAIEQDADLVLFLHRLGDAPATSLIVAKHRHGETGKLTLAWHAQATRFSDGCGGAPGEWK